MGAVRLADLTDVHRAVAALASSMEAGDWARETPCPGWDVAAVMRHVVVGEEAFTATLAGVPFDVADLAAEMAELPDEVLPDLLEAAGETLREALAAAGPGEYRTALGPLPVPAIAELRTIESVVHGWDVGQATGRPLVLPEEVVERALVASRRLLPRIPADRTPFAASQPVDGAAPAIDRLAGLLGRRPA